MDTGNYVGDPYPQMERLAPHANIVQAKTYPGGGVWYTLDLDYDRIAGILRNAGFDGWVSLEMEGEAPAGGSGRGELRGVAQGVRVSVEPSDRIRSRQAREA